MAEPDTTRGKKWWKWLLAPSAVAAAAATLVVTFTVTRGPLESPTAMEESQVATQESADVAQAAPSAPGTEKDALREAAVPADGLGRAPEPLQGAPATGVAKSRKGSTRPRKHPGDIMPGRKRSGSAREMLAKPKTATGRPVPSAPAAVADAPSSPPPPRAPPMEAMLDADAKDESAKKKQERVGLSHAAIEAVVKQNQASFKPCLQTAHDAGNIEAGMINLVLSWTVTHNGTVEKAKATGAQKKLHKDLTSCLTQKLTAWRFPASDAGTVIERMVLPVTIVP